MSVPTTARNAVIAPEGRFSQLPGSSRIWLYVSMLLVAMSATRIVTGAGDITSEGTFRAAMIAAVPIALAGLGGLWSERAGVVNIGLEGMMIMGTLGAGYFGYHYGVWAGLLGAMFLGAMGGVLHAIATVVFGVDHIVSGVAINIIAAGAASFMAELMFAGLPGGGPTQSPSLPRPPTITIPGVSDALQSVGDTDWFVVSDLANVLASLTTRLSVFTIVAILLLVGTGFVLWKTSFGLRLRSCGESPSAAESLGVNVYLYKFIAVTMSGVMAGAGGAYLAMVASSGYQNGQTLGLGYIGLAAMIFGNWRPTGLFFGALLFGYTYAARLRSGGESVHALLLIVAVALILLAVWQLRKGISAGGIATAVVGAGALFWYLTTDTIPGDFTQMTPYVATLLVLAFASQSLRMPAADGQPYRRGSAG
jgi:ABC-type uncharacterized transport system permease subunit